MSVVQKALSPSARWMAMFISSQTIDNILYSAKKVEDFHLAN